MIEAKNATVRFDGDDIWVNGDLISKCGFDEEWTVFEDGDKQSEFETLAPAVAYVLGKSHDSN